MIDENVYVTGKPSLMTSKFLRQQLSLNGRAKVSLMASTVFPLLPLLFLLLLQFVITDNDGDALLLVVIATSYLMRYCLHQLFMKRDKRRKLRNYGDQRDTLTSAWVIMAMALF